MFNIRQTLRLFIALTFFMCNPASSDSYSIPQESSEIGAQGVIEIEAILALNTTMRSMIDTFVKPIGNRERRAEALYDLMFGTDKFALKYDNSHTKTAIETIESGSGNCVSLSNAFIAMARYANLEANYLDVEVPQNWQHVSDDDVYYQLKHISATVKVSGREYLGIEYRWMGAIGLAKTRIIDDQEAFAAFYSNLGVELLAQDKMDAAIAYLKRATELDPDNANNWSNLGVAYRRQPQLDEAEQAYLQALKKDKTDLTALNNLAILYQMTGRQELADKYSKKLERYHLRNPYYLIKLAKDEMNAGNYSQALKYANKAITKYDDEHEFYFVAAQIYAHEGDTEKAMESLKNAERYALSAMNRDLYSRKLELLGEPSQFQN